MRELIRVDRYPETFLDAYLNPEKPVDWDLLYEGYDAALDWYNFFMYKQHMTL